MGVSTHKKVLISRFERETLAGFVNPQTWLQSGAVELLTTTGTVTSIPYREVKMVNFVRDFNDPGASGTLRTFSTRPKLAGLWVRLRLRDGAVLDGVMANDLLQVESEGFSMIPPDPNYQNQRLWIPRAAVAEIRVLGVIGTRAGKRKPAAKDGSQLEMFDAG